MHRGVAVVLVLGLLHACGSNSKRKAATPDETKSVTHTLPGDDRSRCDYKDRPDREVRETAGPGAIQPNIRRVYAIVGEGEDRRRVLTCREVDTNLDGVKDVVRTYNDLGESLHELADSNYDGRVDTWTTFARGRIAKEEIDNTGNGKPDEIRHYIRGKKRRVQRDTNGDGKPDVWEIYDEGRLQRMGQDLDHDGHVDRWLRDEIQRQQDEERERAEAEADGGGADGAGEEGGAPDAGAADAATDAYVSPRRR